MIDCERFDENSFLDLKLEWNEEDHENVNVSMDIYEKACVTDAKEGAEVRDFVLRNIVRFDLVIRSLLELVFL